jgi:soluble lytic murein transglycosylase
MGGHLALASAAYNAGPQRARSWIPGERSMPADLWVESVPVTETHAYVRQVLAYTIIYRERLGLPPIRLTDQLPPIGGGVSARDQPGS